MRRDAVQGYMMLTKQFDRMIIRAGHNGCSKSLQLFGMVSTVPVHEYMRERMAYFDERPRGPATSERFGGVGGVERSIIPGRVALCPRPIGTTSMPHIQLA